MIGQRGRAGRGASTRPAGVDRAGAGRVADALRASRAALVVTAIVALALGGVLLPDDAGARPPTRVGSSGHETFRPVVLGGPGAGEPAPDHVAGARTTSPPEPATPADVDLDAWGLALVADPGVATEPAATLVPAPPEVVRFRPRDGWSDVTREAQLSVRFTTAMDQATTEAAFHATIDGTDVTGSLRWAEGDTVLVLRPSTALPYGARVELRVDERARSAIGSPIVAAASVTFTVAARPAATPSLGGASTSGWVWPLIGPITQLFGQTLTKYGVHQGIDIDGDVGEPVQAARSGVVVVAGYADECGGLQVRVDHGGGLLTWYRHLSAVEVGVGDAVTAGSTVGRVGATGCATGSHLHFGVSLRGDFVDPLRYLPPR